MAPSIWRNGVFLVAALSFVHAVAGSSWEKRADIGGFAGRHTGGVTVMDDKVWMLGGGTFLLAFSELKEYNPSTNKWVAHSDPPWGTWGRTGVGMTSIGEELWVYGGQDQTQVTHDDMYKYSRAGWELITPSSSANPTNGRKGHGFTALGNFIYLFGGNTGASFFNPGGADTNEMWKFNPADLSWTEMRWVENEESDYVDIRQFMGFEPFQDMLYLFGGSYESNSQLFNDMYRMDPSVEPYKWTELKPETSTLPGPRYNFGFAATDNAIYVFAGRAHLAEAGTEGPVLQDLHMYVPDDDGPGTWTNLTDLSDPNIPRARYGVHFSAVGGQLFAWGGRDDSTFGDSGTATEMYVYGKSSSTAAAEAAAAAFSAFVAVGVATATTSAVGSSAAAGSVSGGATAGIGSATASAGVAFALLGQSQFIAISGRIGGGGTGEESQEERALPEESAALGDGLAWLNFHWGSIDAGCPAMKGDNLELTATVLVCLSAICVASALRLLFERLMPPILNKFGRSVPKGGLFPFPAWELTVLDIQSTGILESTGYAMGSGCGGYVAGGVIVLLIYLGVLGAIIYLILHGVKTHSHSGYKEGSDDTFAGESGGEAAAAENGTAPTPPPPPPGAESAATPAEEGRSGVAGCGFYESIKSKHEQLEEWRHKGEWVTEQEETEHKVWESPWSNFHKRYGGAFDTHTERGLIYWLWTYVRAFLVGLILGVVTDAKANSAIIFVIFMVDGILLCAIQPFIDKIANFTAIYNFFFRFVQLSVTLATINGSLSAAGFNAGFFTIAALTLIPLIIWSVISPVVEAMRTLWSLYQSFGLPPPGDSAISQGASLALDNMDTNALAGQKKEEPASPSGPDGPLPAGRGGSYPITAPAAPPTAEFDPGRTPAVGGEDVQMVGMAGLQDPGGDSPPQQENAMAGLQNNLDMAGLQDTSAAPRL